MPRQPSPYALPVNPFREGIFHLRHLRSVMWSPWGLASHFKPCPSESCSSAVMLLQPISARPPATHTADFIPHPHAVAQHMQRRRVTDGKGSRKRCLSSCSLFQPNLKQAEWLYNRPGSFGTLVMCRSANPSQPSGERSRSPPCCWLLFWVLFQRTTWIALNYWFLPTGIFQVMWALSGNTEMLSSVYNE